MELVKPFKIHEIIVINMHQLVNKNIEKETRCCVLIGNFVCSTKVTN